MKYLNMDRTSKQFPKIRELICVKCIGCYILLKEVTLSRIFGNAHDWAHR